GVPELLSDRENGLVVPSEDPAALAAALEGLIRDPSLRRRLGNAAETRVRMHFDHHSSIDTLMRLFDQARGRAA
ncbi:MAG: glycosyltransferase, partial [Rhizobiaceae bacterium]|nr:glycosyltransferase [Rhizobiaceae bacterium]